MLQRLSLAGCLAAVVGGPALVFGAADGMPLAAQLSICFTVGGFGIFTTSESSTANPHRQLQMLRCKHVMRPKTACSSIACMDKLDLPHTQVCHSQHCSSKRSHTPCLPLDPELRLACCVGQVRSSRSRMWYVSCRPSALVHIAVCAPSGI